MILFRQKFNSKATKDTDQQRRFARNRQKLLHGRCYIYQGPYTEWIDHWFEPFFVKEIRRVIEWLREITTADQHC